MKYFLAVFGIVAASLLLKYRERAGEALGHAAWMDKVGGAYGVIMIAAVFIYFWSIATITGTMDIFLAPIDTLFDAIAGNSNTPALPPERF